MKENKTIYLVLMIKKRNRPRIAGVYDTEEERANAVKEYFSTQGISGIARYTDTNELEYICPDNITIRYQSMVLNDRLRDNLR